jgi:hypothetical protein
MITRKIKYFDHFLLPDLHLIFHLSSIFGCSLIRKRSYHFDGMAALSNCLLDVPSSLENILLGDFTNK